MVSLVSSDCGEEKNDFDVLMSTANVSLVHSSKGDQCASWRALRTCLLRSSRRQRYESSPPWGSRCSWGRPWPWPSLSCATCLLSTHPSSAQRTLLILRSAQPGQLAQSAPRIERSRALQGSLHWVLLSPVHHIFTDIRQSPLPSQTRLQGKRNFGYYCHARARILVHSQWLFKSDFSVHWSVR